VRRAVHGERQWRQQLLQVIDLMAQPAPIVVQSVLSFAGERERRAGLRHEGID
jgi:hypothetical protein